MHRLTTRTLATCGLLASIALSHAGSAEAAPKDKAATKLRDQAMDEDYLSVEFEAAEEKLNEAVELCGKKGCSGKVLASVYIGLATVKGVGLQDLDAAKEALVKALEADKGAKLIEGLSTPELEEAFAEAKEEAGSGGDDPEDGEDGEDGNPPAGDFEHEAVTEQEINTPIPIYVKVPSSLGATNIKVMYKPFGGEKWLSIQLKKYGTGHGGEIPCKDVTTTGTLKYYVIAADDEGSPIGFAGSSTSPYTVNIVNKLTGDPPAMPGKEPPKQCMAKEDCPPGLPGCPAASGSKTWGSVCEESSECEAGLNCVDNVCAEGEGDDGGSSSDKIGLLIGLGLQLDMALIGGQDNVCNIENNESYACFVTSSGEQFYGDPADVEGSNGISGGLGIGGARVLLNADYMILRDLGIALGARLGFAFGGSPSSETAPPQGSGHSQAKSFLPIHGEGRATWVIGGGDFNEGDIKPHIFVGGGIAQVNASVPVKVCDRNATGPAGGCNEGSLVEVDAYQITGLNFIGFGGGASYMFTDMIGAQGELKFMIMLPTSGFVIAPTIGPMLAF